MLGLFLVLSGLPQAEAQTLRFTEIFHHPAGTNLLAQWVELYNPGNVAVDIAGWRLRRAVEFEMPAGTRVEAGRYLVVAADRALFRAAHPTVSAVVGGWQGFLGFGGDEIRLEDSLGREIETVAYAAEGDWAERRLGEPDALKRVGWQWHADHDGGGKSLELVSLGLPGEHGQNWASSAVPGGTPGAANSVGRTNGPPLVLGLVHAPLIPRSTDPVTVTARLLDEGTDGLSLSLSWRVDPSPEYTTVPMLDDGAQGDGVARDGLFGAILPPQRAGSVVEFFVRAEDSAGNARVYPAVVPSGNARSAYPVYQVDDAVDAGDQPVYRLIMTRAEHDYLADQIWGGEPRSDAEISGTFVSRDGVMDQGATVHCRYLCGFRNRGHGTRTAVPHNFHVAFPADRPWKGRSGLHLNTHNTHSQHAGSAIFRHLGVAMAESQPVQVRVRGANLALPGLEQFGSYAANDAIDDRLVKRQFPTDPAGNLYRGVRDLVPGISASADLAWRGASFEAYTNAYSKENHATRNDWSDFIRLVDVLNHTADSNYVAKVRSVVDVDQWMRYFAINTLLDNQENSLANGVGDDFGLYRGVIDPRFRLVPYDLDSLMGRGTRETSPLNGLWRMTNVAVIDRFMKRPEFVPDYYRHLREFGDGMFAPQRMNPLLDQWLGSYVDATTVGRMKTFNSNHVAHVLSLVPRRLSVQPDFPVSAGYPRSTSLKVTLSGAADAVGTRRVRVQGQPAVWTAWTASWVARDMPLRPGINRVLIEALDDQGQVLDRLNYDLWCDVRTPRSVSGTLGSDTRWIAADGPYLVVSPVTVASKATLTIEAGATVYFGAGATLTVADGGRLVAVGTDAAPIWFGVVPGTAVRWGGITLLGSAGSPETQLAHLHLEGNSGTAIHATGATLFMDHVTFGSTESQYLSLDRSSFLVRDCVFPSGTTSFELAHGSGGIKAGGRGIFLRNFFGATRGYSDVVDFTGGRRAAGQPIVQFLENVFIGSSDDAIDLDGTDAWVEGNLFLHVHKNGSPDSSSAISGGSDSGASSAVTIVGNLFYDCDQLATAKQGNFYTVLNNTLVRQTRVGGLDTDAAVVNFADDGTSEGAGMHLEGNILVDVEKLTRNLTAAAVTFTNNLMPVAWAGPGGGNSTADPLLEYLPRMEETQFTSYEEAQVLRRWFRPRAGSPAWRSGPNGRDLGGVVPRGVSISGAPAEITSRTTASLRIGTLLRGGNLPVTGWPQGSGYLRYRWRLDAGAWSAELPITSVLGLEGLAPGEHRLEVSGINDAGLFQDDPLPGGAAGTATTVSWRVDPSYLEPVRPAVRLSEILAGNTRIFGADGSTPDLIELENSGTEPVDLGGMGMTDEVLVPRKFVFPAGTVLAPGAFLVVEAGNARASGAGGGVPHVPFGLSTSGDAVYLFESPARGGALVDAVEFGIQIPDHSVARLGDGTWGLAEPTFGARNRALRLGEPAALRINEWLTDAQFLGGEDFMELYNPLPLPVALGGLFLSDAAGSVRRQQIAALSFVGARGFATFLAGASAGLADHLDFGLSPEVGTLRLSGADGSLIDVVTYGAQRTDVSRGRSPNGSEVLASFTQPTPGAGNPGGATGDCQIATTTFELLPLGASWKYRQTENLDGKAWVTPDYDDSAWPEGPALLAVESSALPAPGKLTPLTLGRTTYYFRSRFVVNTNLAGFQLNLAMAVDDGAVVYLNGTRLLVQGIGTSTPVYATFANRNVDNAVLEYFTVPGTALVEGTNVIAAEVHQANAGSTDIVWGLGVHASRTFTNCGPGEVGGVILSEVLADNSSVPIAQGRTSDYVELHNAGSAAVDLSGLSLTDDLSFPAKWVFPAGARLEPGAYRVVACDPEAGPTADNTGFGLRSEGGSVYLFNRAGGGGNLLDALTYGFQVPDLSLGRTPEGGGTWTLNLPTPGAPNRSAGLGSVSAVRINEWMADPLEGGDWFELWNSGTLPVSLAGLYLTDDLADPTQSPIPPLSFLGSGGDGYRRIVADGSAAAGADHVNFSLRKSGEALGLFTSNGVMLDGVNFGPQAQGVSQGRFPDGAVFVSNFPASASPGAPNRLPLASPVINEVLTHTDPPLEDAIELYNPTELPIDLGGWYLGRSARQPKQYRIPDGTVVPARGYRVFYQAQFGAGPTGFTLNSAHGDSVVLSQADAAGRLTGYSDLVSFGAVDNGVSLGRHPTSVGFDFTVLAARTFGQDQPASPEEFRSGAGLINSGPRVGPVVVSEIHFQPISGGGESLEDEFIELENAGAFDVPLFDPLAPTNTWRLRDAVDFDFPEGIRLGAGERLLIVGFPTSDPVKVDAFRTRWSVPPGVRILGAWSGRLANDRDNVELTRPDVPQSAPHPDAGFVPRIVVDRVGYSASAPWPVAAAGTGQSLQRISPTAYGNDPVHWVAAAPTPGRPGTSGSADTDGDGLDDAWEIRWFGGLGRDGSGDFDGDGMLDRAEFVSGTSPADPADALRLAVPDRGRPAVLRFEAVAGRTYTVQCSDDVGGTSWRRVADVPASPTRGTVSVSDPTGGVGTRFYRVVTPRIP